MLRIPTYSIALLALGIIIGAIAGDKDLGFALGGFGSLIGYAIWLKARIVAVKEGKAFHLGSVLNIFMCTFISLALGIFGIFGSVDSINIWIIPIFAGFVCWLHWHFAQKVRLLPTAGEIGHEVVRTIFAHGPGEASAEALFEVSREYVKDLREKKGAT